MSILFDRKGNDIAIKNANDFKDLEFVANQIAENIVINFSIPAYFDGYGYITKICYSFIGEDGYATPVEEATNVDSNTIELKNVSIPSSTFIFRPLEVEFSLKSPSVDKYFFVLDGVCIKNAVDGGSYSCTPSEMENLFNNKLLDRYDPTVSSERNTFGYTSGLYGNSLSIGKKVSDCLLLDNGYFTGGINASMGKGLYYYTKLDNPEQVIVSGANSILFSVYHTATDFLVCNGISTFTVEESTVVDIELIKSPRKMFYNYRETIDLTGGVLKVTYDDGRTENKDLPIPSLTSATSQYSYMYGRGSDKIVDIVDTTQWISILYKGCDKVVKYSVTVPKYTPSSMEDVDWETLQILSKRGKLQDYFSVGNTKSLILNGGVTPNFRFSSYSSKAMLVDIDENNKESVFMLEDRFAFTEYDVSSVSEDPVYNGETYSFSVNKTSTNIGGWQGSFLRTVMVFFSAVLPVDLLNCIMAKPSEIYSDNVGDTSTSADSITTSTEYLFPPSEYEVFGTNTYGNPHESEKLHQWGVYVNSEGSDKVKIQKSPNGTFSETPANYWLRTANSNNATSWVCVNEFGMAEPKECNKVIGVNPCWRL